MSNHVSYEERYRRIMLVYDCIKEGMSTRECANYLTSIGVKISNATVKDYIDRMYFYNQEKYQEMLEIMTNHKPKTVDSEEVRTRIKNVVVALNAGYTFKEIATALGVSEFTVYRDYKNRIDMLSKEELKELGISDDLISNIDIRLNQNSINNLNKGKKI